MVKFFRYKKLLNKVTNEQQNNYLTSDDLKSHSQPNYLKPQTKECNFLESYTYFNNNLESHYFISIKNIRVNYNTSS